MFTSKGIVEDHFISPRSLLFSDVEPCETMHCEDVELFRTAASRYIVTGKRLLSLIDLVDERLYTLLQDRIQESCILLPKNRFEHSAVELNS